VATDAGRTSADVQGGAYGAGDTTFLFVLLMRIQGACEDALLEAAADLARRSLSSPTTTDTPVAGHPSIVLDQDGYINVISVRGDVFIITSNSLDFGNAFLEGLNIK
jgi:hypothetical protein